MSPTLPSVPRFLFHPPIFRAEGEDDCIFRSGPATSLQMPSFALSSEARSCTLRPAIQQFLPTTHESPPQKAHLPPNENSALRGKDGSGYNAAVSLPGKLRFAKTLLFGCGPMLKAGDVAPDFPAT